MFNLSGFFDKWFMFILGNDLFVGIFVLLRNWMLCGVGCYFLWGSVEEVKW